ncbi:2OG-Fe dioxygenase family protein [Pseudosulfitobacter koreensis]|uniref:2OG-Fe dioxygenase family protein n=1 Tax=Pseudosulfitobacter koreensis TaxID=2968472 RepID=A0ABT1YXJ3_9RHOB|nr:2OG-Fe dioxygenase family protein [Pseudosulfitobacter koreense]MCR8825597.1 2OG-Fe dioxygenase family protein [Pseudosulfitobacter koreense]
MQSTTLLKQKAPPPQGGRIYCEKLAKYDFVQLSSDTFLREIGDPEQRELNAFCDSWNSLEVDQYMADGGTYRLRRHGIFSATRAGGGVAREKHQPHYQTTDFNDLNGGVKRHFAPIEDAVAEGRVLGGILSFASRSFGMLSPMNDWHIEAHQFRINAQTTGGKPTPEGVHRDGVDYVLMTLIARNNVVNGTTRVLDSDQNEVAQFTLTDPFETVMVNDLRVAHGVSAILPAAPDIEGHRDMLVVTFKRK